MVYLNEYEQKWIIILVLDSLSVCSVPLFYPVARQIKWVAHSNSTSIKMAVYKSQINGQLVVVVLASAALIINPITFHSAPVMKVKAIRGLAWLPGKQRSKCSTPPREPILPRCLTVLRAFYLFGVTGASMSSLPKPFTTSPYTIYYTLLASERGTYWEPEAQFLSLIKPVLLWPCHWTFLFLLYYVTKFFCASVCAALPPSPPTPKFPPMESLHLYPFCTVTLKCM